VPAGQSSDYVADWPCLFARVGPVLEMNLSLVVVFDNVHAAIPSASSHMLAKGGRGF
jgi:hypothetical protein